MRRHHDLAQGDRGGGRTGSDFIRVCAGPVQFPLDRPQHRIVAKRFPGYWDAKSIHFDSGESHLAQSKFLGAAREPSGGALDIVEDILPTDVPAVQKDPKLKTAIDDLLA